MARVLVAPTHPQGGRRRLAHCQACWQEVYLSGEDIEHVWSRDRGVPVLCPVCAERLAQKGTLA